MPPHAGAVTIEREPDERDVEVARGVNRWIDEHVRGAGLGRRRHRHGFRERLPAVTRNGDPDLRRRAVEDRPHRVDVILEGRASDVVHGHPLLVLDPLNCATLLVTVNSDTSVTATFSLIPETLAVSKKGDGAGAVMSSPAGIDCGTSCSHAYDYGTSVTLTASSSAGSSFSGWTGACAGTASCVVTMTAAHSITASFVKDCVVPKLERKGLKAAERAIKAHDCSVAGSGAPSPRR